MTGTKRITFAIFILCLFFICFIKNTKVIGSEPDYYIVDGQKIFLQISKNYSAIKMKPEASGADIRAFESSIDSARFGTVEKSPVLEKYNIVLIHAKEGVDPSSFRAGADNFRANARVETENPVYSIGGIDQLLVNEFIVQFKSDASQESINRSIKENNAEIVKKDKKIKNRYILRFSGKLVREALATSNDYTQDSLVEFSEPNFIRIYPQRPKIEKKDIQTKGTENPSSDTTSEDPWAISPSSSISPNVIPGDPLFSKQWPLNNTGLTGIADADIDALEAWDVEKGSKNIIIAIIDEGVDTNHKDLRDKIVTPYDATDGDDDQEPKAWDGHGTSCAGIAAAMTGNALGVAGVGWNVKILPVRIAYSNAQGGPWITDTSTIEDGLRTAVDRGAHVLSNSWGGGSSSSAINSGIDHAIANNRVVVFAAANDAGPVSYPANLSLSKVLIAVSASNEWDQFKTKTSLDGESWWGSNFGPEISVAAPGVHIYTTDISGADGYANGDYVPNFNGTSSSTPFVAGVAALLLSQNPTLGPSEVRDCIQSTADDLGAPGFDNQFGHGRTNAFNALKKNTPDKFVFEYAAKFVCGLQKDPLNKRLTRGYYATAINIHNPHKSDVKFFKKLALTFPPGKQKPGMIVPIGKEVLRYDEALEVDCEEIDKVLKKNGIKTPYAKGFVVIQSPTSIDVTAVYTASAIDNDGQITTHSSIDVEQIRERRISEEIDLADLIPVPDKNGFFCKRRGDKLVVTVKNQGLGSSKLSTTEVDFLGLGKFAKPTPPLAPGDSEDLLFEIPRGCFDPDCGFSITVDVMNEVSEKDEGNNTGNGTCIG